jgi:hypothetical protein
MEYGIQILYTVQNRRAKMDPMGNYRQETRESTVHLSTPVGRAAD